MAVRELLAGAILALVCANLGSAETVKPAFGGDFTFKKIKPPSSNAGKRITIQIEPGHNPFPEGERQVTVTKPSVSKPGTGKSDQLDWFWSEISPAIDASGPGRFLNAVDQVGRAPKGKSLPQPRLNTLRDIASVHGSAILSETIGKKVSPALVLALISVESSGRVDAESHKGAQGLMQLIPATAERFGVRDSRNPKENIKGGIAYLDWLMKEFDGDPILALAGYNAGENAVKKHGGVPPYAETRAYVPKVLAAWKVARGLCLTPPELASDGCVFKTGS